MATDIFTRCETLCNTDNLIPQNSKVLVAVSGGKDSMALLHVLARLLDTGIFGLHVSTLDHGLRGEAGVADADFVAEIASHMGLPCTRETINVHEIMDTYNIGLEVAARQARYTYLLKVAMANDCDHIALAHHRNDQAETVLMHLIRGSGLHGLSGMSMRTPLSETHLLPDWEQMLALNEAGDVIPSDFMLIRPLLDISREDIYHYVDIHQIPYRVDATNDDTTYLRNAVRHEILPVLSKHNPRINNGLARLANIVQHDLETLNKTVDNVAAWLLEWTETRPQGESDDPGEAVFIDRDGFREQSVSVQRRLIRKIIDELWPGAQDIAFDLIEQARQLVLHGRTSTGQYLYEDIRLQVGYDDVIIGYGGDPVYPSQLPHLNPGQEMQLDTADERQITRVGELDLVMYQVVEGRSRDWRTGDPLEVSLSLPEGADLRLRTWRYGDRFHPFGMHGRSQKLSDTFVNSKVPVYYRDQVPLLTVNGEIAWILAPTASGPVSKIADTFAVRSPNDTVLRFRWQRPALLPLP